MLKGHLYFKTWYKRLVFSMLVVECWNVVRHFSESPFYKTEQSGVVVGKWGWAVLELHSLTPPLTLCSLLWGPYSAEVRIASEACSSEAWLCLQLALGSRQLTEAFWTSLSIKWTDLTRSKDSSPSFCGQLQRSSASLRHAIFCGFLFFSGETWYSFVSFLKGSCSPNIKEHLLISEILSSSINQLFLLYMIESPSFKLA